MARDNWCRRKAERQLLHPIEFTKQKQKEKRTYGNETDARTSTTSPASL
jgi:hypothetical protein